MWSHHFLYVYCFVGKLYKNYIPFYVRFFPMYNLSPKIFEVLTGHRSLSRFQIDYFLLSLPKHGVMYGILILTIFQCFANITSQSLSRFQFRFHFQLRFQFAVLPEFFRFCERSRNKLSQRFFPRLLVNPAFNGLFSPHTIPFLRGV